MQTFRVYIRRPQTQAPIWDWAQTVVSASAQSAISSSYQDWVDSHPSYTIPPLNQCTAQANPVALSGKMGLVLATSASDLTPAQQAFIKAIQSKVAQFLGTQLDGNFQVVSYPSGFNYGITYGNNAYFNQATLQDIDTLLGVANNGELELTGGGFSNYYSQLLQAVAFTFSQADQKTMNDQDTAASAQISSIITAFLNAGGTFSSPLPFGGKLQDIFNQLTKQYGSLSNLPAGLNELRNAIAAYQSMAAQSYALHNRYYAATDRLQAAQINCRVPSAANGGMQVGANSYYPGFTPNKLPSANQLIGSLSTLANAISVEIDVSNFQSGDSSLNIAGGGGFEIPIAEIIGISVNGSASYDLSKYTSSSSKLTMNINYPGVT
jgi:hypothetical protein